MRFLSIRPTLAAAAIVAAAGALAAGVALVPASAGSTGPNPDAIVKCTSSSPCQTYKNTGLGAALEGINTKNSAVANGLVGSAGTFGNGVLGFAGASGNGISGQGGNTGVSGTGGNWGVFGFTSLSGATGVEGQSDNGTGVDGTSVCCDGVVAFSESGVGLFALNADSNPAVVALGSTGDGIDVQAAAGGNDQVALRATNNGDNGSDGNGADIQGSYIGVIARNVANQGFPLVAADSNGTDLMFVDSAGNLFYHGGLFNFARTSGGGVATTYGARSASPTIEDNGTAQLVNGAVTVQLDPAFAHSIDGRQAYQVMLTPDGDTKGLFIASKSPTSFTVREVQGGRSTIAFDYHIYGQALGQAGRRMVEMTQAQAAKMMPHAPYVAQRAQPRPVIKTLHH
jgi:hypothetical protein